MRKLTLTAASGLGALPCSLNVCEMGACSHLKSYSIYTTYRKLFFYFFSNDVLADVFIVHVADKLHGIQGCCDHHQTPSCSGQADAVGMSHSERTLNLISNLSHNKLRNRKWYKEIIYDEWGTKIHDKSYFFLFVFFKTL